LISPKSQHSIKSSKSHGRAQKNQQEGALAVTMKPSLQPKQAEDEAKNTGGAIAIDEIIASANADRLGN